MFVWKKLKAEKNALKVILKKTLKNYAFHKYFFQLFVLLIRIGLKNYGRKRNGNIL